MGPPGPAISGPGPVIGPPIGPGPLMGPPGDMGPAPGPAWGPPPFSASRYWLASGPK